MRLAWLVTSLGDLFAASVVAGVIIVWSWINLNRLIALTFAICVGATFGLVTAIKLWTGRHLPEPELVALWLPSAGAPSGHSAMAAVVYGCAAAIFVKRGQGPLAATGLLGCLMAIALVCITRVTLDTHTAADVVAGLAVAGGFIALFARVLDVQAQDHIPRIDTLMISMLIVALFAVISRVRISSAGIL